MTQITTVNNLKELVEAPPHQRWGTGTPTPQKKKKKKKKKNERKRIYQFADIIRIRKYD
jgi:hypothetical protein